MPDIVIMSDKYLQAFAKNGDSLTNEDEVHSFLQPWSRVQKYSTALFECIKKVALMAIPKLFLQTSKTRDSQGRTCF